MTGAEIAIIAVGAVAAGASAYGAYSASEAQAQAAEYNRKIARNQAILAEQQAAVEAETLSEKQRRLRAAQRVAFAEGGVSEEGSPLMTMADSARLMARDIYLTRYGGDVRASGFEAEAQLQRIYARTARQQGMIGAGVSLLSSGAGIVANTYYGRYGGYYGNRYDRYGGVAI